jgi:hypothetical protein
MQLSPSTAELLTTLKTFSGNRLTRQDDLGTLIELAVLTQQEKVLDDLSFLAKFLSNVYGIMKRIGPGAEGYDKLAVQFNENFTKATALVRSLIEKSPEDVSHRFSCTYFDLSQDALSNFLALLYDLSWYKNWRIDNPGS